MAAERERKTGLGSLPAGLLRPTATMPPAEPTAKAATPKPPEPSAESDNDDGPDDGDEGQGGKGAGPTVKPVRTRRKRVQPGGETKGRKFHLPDDIHDRLWLLARQRRTTVSAVAADLLDKALPRYRVEREG